MRRLLALLGVVVALALSVRAQEPAQQPPPAAPATQEQDASGQPVFRTGINFVRVDVIATDRQGNPVLDLSRDDFEISEDGKPQTVETFRLVKIDPTTSEYASPGIRTREDLAEMAVDEITDIEDMDAERAAALIMEARKHWFE